MTIAQMHTLMDLLIDKADAPWFNPIEKDIFLNNAISEYVDNKYSQFELNEKIRKDLITLVVFPYTVADTDTINLEEVPNFRYTLAVEADITGTCGSKSGIDIKPRQFDDLAKSRRDPFNKSNDLYPVYVEYNDGGIRVIKVHSDSTPSALRMTYLKNPVIVNFDDAIDSDLPAHTHKDIVNIAVRKAFATLENGDGYQLQLNEILNQE